MYVYEIKLKLFLIKDITLKETQSRLASFIDKSFSKEEELIKFHEENKFKNYCFDLLYPIEEDKIYKKDNIYTLRIRTVSKTLADFFSSKLVNCFDKYMKALVSEIKIIPKKPIEKIYSITPVVLKNEEGYWKHKISLEDFERRLKENLIKKHNVLTNSKINEDFEFYNSIEFKNHKPIATNYKDIKLLGDKISLTIADNENAQKLAYMALGCGVLEANGRGFGFMNFKWY